MSKRSKLMEWPRERLFAVAIDGAVLMNARALDEVNLAELATQKDVFIGVPLTGRELGRVREQFTDASSEAAAFVGGGRRRKTRLRRRGANK